MKWDIALRSIGVLGLVAAYGVFRVTDGSMDVYAFGLVVMAIVGIVAPEVIDQLPFGPTK